MHYPIPPDPPPGCPECGGDYVAIHHGEYLGCDSCEWSNCGLEHGKEC